MPAGAAYDYVIVGAGSAGCVLAARLSENPSVTVLLLEAGGPDDADEIHIPAALSRTFKSAYDWNYTTEAQPNVNGRRLYWPRGKTLGGSSSINAMLYIRGNRLDFDGWAAAGCVGWSYDDLLPYFLKAEDNARGRSEFHSVGGPLRVEDQKHPHEMSRLIHLAAVDAGIPDNDDFNGKTQDGTGFFQVTQRDGRRWSAADAYLHPVTTRPNLTVHTDALVQRVNTEDGRAVGVRFRRAGQLGDVRAETEVILCGGAINSPQLLMLSGIGPAGHLTSLGIDVVQHSPNVGQRLQDHPLTPAQFYAPGLKDLFAADRLPYFARWFANRSGPLTSPVAEVCAFIRGDRSAAAPDLQFHMIPAMLREHDLVPAPGVGLTMCTTLVDVASRGEIRLVTADPRHRPSIDPGYLREPADLRVLIEGLKIAREIAAQPVLDQHITTEAWPGRQARTDPELAEHVRAHLETLYHPTSTCALGPHDDDVVDLELRVRGVAGLRVVDASVMPGVPRGNTNAPTIAIAEKAADLIAGAA
jgi:choline dehydrogenase